MPRFNQGFRQSPDLTQEQVKDIQQRYAKGEKRKDLRKEFSQSEQRMADIISGRYEIKRWGKVL